MTRGKKILLLFLSAVLLPGVCVLLLDWFMNRPRGLPYWQRQAVAVHPGMTRADVQKLLPMEDYEGLLWAVENFRFKLWPGKTPLLHAPEFKLMSSNAWSHQMYELEKGVAVVIRYDRSGSLPGAVPPSTGSGVLQPGDKVVLVPVVTDTVSAGKLHSEYWRHP